MVHIAIGDIHGSLDKIKALMELIGNKYTQGTLVFLGDYIDRGPDSKGVINFIRSKPLNDFDYVYLKGNHEDMSINDINLWLYNGGEATINSYGDLPQFVAHEHYKWFDTLPTHYKIGKYLFVHAGIDPYKKLENQDESDFFWIRQTFLNNEQIFDYYVVHGHTPIPHDRRTLKELKYDGNLKLSDLKPIILSNRINLDTAAVYGGPLSAVVIKDVNKQANEANIEIIQVK